MRCFTLPLILLLTALLCNEAKSETLELTRKKAVAPALKMEEIAVAGQRRFHILTEHFDITAFKAEDGILVGQQLEHLFHAWELLSAEFLKEEATKTPVQLRCKVVLYRDKEEYEVNLRRIDPNIALSNGFYYAPEKTAYFYSSETRVLFHEGTHQILAEHFFCEHASVFPNNFWIVEGIALFMQTLKIEEKTYKLGDIMDDRLFSAKKYQFEQNYSMPIRRLTAMSMRKIHASTDLQKIYSQSATLVHWLMFAEKGRYRGVVFELLRQTYRDSATPESLNNLTDLSYEELDVKYVEFLKTIPK
jgi:hypothetical protein